MNQPLFFLISLSSVLLHVVLYFVLSQPNYETTTTEPAPLELIFIRRELIADSAREKPFPPSSATRKQLNLSELLKTKVPVDSTPSDEPDAIQTNNVSSDNGQGAQLRSAVHAHNIGQWLHGRINAHLQVPAALLEKENEVQATIPFEVSAQGRFIRIIKDEMRGDTSAIGLGTSAITKALSGNARTSFSTTDVLDGPRIFTAHFIFEKYSKLVGSKIPTAPVANRDLFFARNNGHDALLEVKNIRKEGMPIHTLNLDLHELYTRWFGTPPPDNRMEWDLVHREKELRYHCRTGQADGACLEIAKLLLLQGEVAESKRFREQACNQGLAEACDQKPN